MMLQQCTRRPPPPLSHPSPRAMARGVGDSGREHANIGSLATFSFSLFHFFNLHVEIVVSFKLQSEAPKPKQVLPIFIFTYFRQKKPA